MRTLLLIVLLFVGMLFNAYGIKGLRDLVPEKIRVEEAYDRALGGVVVGWLIIGIAAALLLS